MTEITLGEYCLQSREEGKGSGWFTFHFYIKHKEEAINMRDGWLKSGSECRVIDSEGKVIV